METLFHKILMRNKSILVILAVFMLVLLMSVSNAPVQLLPHIEQNQLIVTTLLSGTDAERMEQTITVSDFHHLDFKTINIPP